MYILLIATGLVCLVVGGEGLVRGASGLARRLGISPLVIGLTLVGFGTSTPELVTSLQAALSGAPGIAIGNVVGSNTANILLILGLTAIIAPFAIAKAAFIRDGAVVFVAALMALCAVQFDVIDARAGIIFLAALIAYLSFVIWSETRKPVLEPASDEQAAPEVERLDPVWLSAVLVVVGISLTILGARFFVSGAITVAELFGISEAVIGLTLVAVGTSLPELVTSVIAALRKQGDLAFGNVIGSNIFNVLCILGITALVHPLEVPEQITRIDIWVMLAATVALVWAAISQWRITRFEGAVLFAGYAGYTGYLIATV